MHIFTSITSNYIPKARVLARSVKTHAPHAVFHLLLCDLPPPGFSIDEEEFDHLIRLDELDIPKRAAWVFQHNVVELCTAVKGLGFERIFALHQADKVVFLDPDIVLFSDLGLIESALDEHSVLLTPHQTEPEKSYNAILDNEVSSLKYGAFNLGFLAVRNSDEGLRFVNWWSRRLHSFCFDDRENGLFTDQKWIDLAPAFFADLAIMRQAQLNVSTWNINQRKLTGDPETGFFVNGKALCFYHFSGLDSGAMKVMMEVYGDSSPALQALRHWYMAQCEQHGQRELGNAACRYDYYSNGARIRPAERLLYRYRESLQEQFPDPFDCSGKGGYRAWYKAHAATAPELSEEEEVVSILRQELDAIQHSISWRVFRKLTTAYRRFGLRLGLRRLLGKLGKSAKPT
ncbi:MAG: glycosyltransferase [Gammaproteobacteria bacterium]|jgi:hypothetical protein|nr:glycosyltransferase [Gammaproteobacteria bacterium]